MRDSYVGDIGDFANNGLLRHLCGMTGPPMADEKPLRLGVAWYLTPENVRVSKWWNRWFSRPYSC